MAVKVQRLCESVFTCRNITESSKLENVNSGTHNRTPKNVLEKISARISYYLCTSDLLTTHGAI